MDINIRKSIISNFKDSSIDEIEEAIDTSIKDGNEITLPGMGVFFEILWDNCDRHEKENVLQLLKQGMK